MFLCVSSYRAQSILRKEFALAVIYALSMMLCILFPTVWLLNNFLRWGDPLHFTRIASSLQANYVGSIPVMQRLLIPLRILFDSFPALSIPGVGAAALYVLINRQLAVYLAPAVFMFVMLWISTGLAFTAPYQEPRYMVVFGWAMIPFIATLVARIWQRKSWVRVLAVIGIVIFIVVNLVEIFSFSNSFGPDVREVANRAGQWLQLRERDARVVVQSESYAERGVIPVVAGYPARFIYVSADQLRSHAEDPAGFLNGLASEWLAIVKDSQFADQACSNGLYVERVGSYFLISAKP